MVLARVQVEDMKELSSYMNMLYNTKVCLVATAF